MKSATHKAWRCKAPLRAQSVKAPEVKVCALLLAALTFPSLTFGARAQVALEGPPRAPGGVKVNERGPGGGVYLEGAKDAGVSLVPSQRLSDAVSGDAWLSELKAGTLSLDEAWARGYLSAGNVLDIAGRWRDWSAEGKRLRVELVRSLAERAPEVLSLESPGALGDWKRLVGVGYQAQKDERAVLWYEAALRDLQSRRVQQGQQGGVGGLVGRAERPALKRGLYGRVTSEGEPSWVAEIGGLARFYAERGQHEKAGQTWERAGDYSRHPDWRADALIEAARAYSRAGQENKAKALYARVSQYENAWFTGLAADDQFLTLISQKKYREARLLIDHSMLGAETEQTKILLLSDSGQLHYAVGEWIKVKKDSEEAIALFESLKPEQRRAGIDTRINTAQARLMMSQQWLKQPLRVEQNEIRVKTQRSENVQPPIIEKIYVRSPKDVSLQVSVNIDKIKAYVSGVKTDESVNSYYFQQEVVVEISANGVSDINAQLTIKSASPSEAMIELPIFVEAEDPVQPSVSSLFFGTVDAGQSVTRPLSFTSPVPFHVVKVESDNTAVKVKLEEPKTTKEQTLQVTLTPSQRGQFYVGTLRVTTDVVGQEVIEVPYAAQSK